MNFSKSIIKCGIFFMLLVFFTSCTKFLQEDVYTEYDPKVFLQTEKGLNSLLNAAYSNMVVTSSMRERMYTLNEFPGDIMWEFGGSFVNSAILYMNFEWDPQESFLKTVWQQYYASIRNANSLIDNAEGITSMSQDRIDQFVAEARFIRAADYYFLWTYFGTVPLIESSNEINLEPSRPTAQEFDDFLTSELSYVASKLPDVQTIYGKATKGAALALLGEYYLNDHQWDKAAETSKEVMQLNLYQLYEGDIKNMFSVQNEQNSEVILPSPSLTTLHGNLYMAHAFPPNYPIQSNWINYGAQFCVYNDWVQTYPTNDERLKWFLFEYDDIDGVHHNLLDPADPARAVRCFKYVPDPDAISESAGNDVPMIRYAEVLLNRSEALNESIGLNQESVDLLNEIRNRAHVQLYELSDFGTKEDFRKALLQERGWEFVAEGKRRLDLSRTGELITRAKDRGATNADDYMKLYPIPSDEISANPNLVQNPGYSD